MNITTLHICIARAFDVPEGLFLTHLNNFSSHLEDKLEVQMDILDEHQVAGTLHEVFSYCYNNRLDESMRLAMSCAVSSAMGHEVKRQEEEVALPSEHYGRETPHKVFSPDWWVTSVTNDETNLGYNDWVHYMINNPEEDEEHEEA